jgi:hypothetical protein
MSKTASSKALQSVTAASEYCLEDFKNFKVRPKLSSKQREVALYSLEMAALNRGVLEALHRHYLLSFADGVNSGGG